MKLNSLELIWYLGLTYYSPKFKTESTISNTYKTRVINSYLLRYSVLYLNKDKIYIFNEPILILQYQQTNKKLKVSIL